MTFSGWAQKLLQLISTVLEGFLVFKTFPTSIIGEKVLRKYQSWTLSTLKIASNNENGFLVKKLYPRVSKGKV